MAEHTARLGREFPTATARVRRGSRAPGVAKYLCGPAHLVLPGVKEIAGATQLGFVPYPDLACYFDHGPRATERGQRVFYPLLEVVLSRHDAILTTADSAEDARH